MSPPTPDNVVAERCTHLGDLLPATLEGSRSRVVRPSSPLTHAWGDPPIRLRCGTPTPAGFHSTSNETTSVNGVRWYQEIGTSSVTWVALRPGVHVELDVPTSYDGQGAYLVDLGPAVKRALP